MSDVSATKNVQAGMVKHLRGGAFEYTAKVQESVVTRQLGGGCLARGLPLPRYQVLVLGARRESAAPTDLLHMCCGDSHSIPRSPENSPLAAVARAAFPTS